MTALLLEARGIPVFAEARRWTGSGRALFVCIDAQYDDALALLRDEDHDVREPVDVDAFHLSERTVALPRLLDYALKALAAIVALWIVVLVVAWWTGSLGSIALPIGR